MKKTIKGRLHHRSLNLGSTERVQRLLMNTPATPWANMSFSRVAVNCQCFTHYRLTRGSDGCGYCWSVAETAELISNDSASLFSTGFICTSPVTVTRSNIFVVNSRLFVFKINFIGTVSQKTSPTF